MMRFLLKLDPWAACKIKDCPEVTSVMTHAVRRDSLNRRIIIIGLLVSLVSFAFAQERTRDVYVDKNGLMRWGHNKEEVHGFGINYTAMFAHAYRTAKRQNISLEQAIDNDVYHFARLGFDFFRVHVWDTEISDSVGNLLGNDHLRLFDYALARMKNRGMKFVITPIAYWGNGWPERDEDTPGFSRKYGKAACLVHPDAIKAQERYLYQFLNHVNPYTALAYKSDPDIIAFEVSNEPHHNESPEKVTGFIDRMVKAMRSTGCKKPIFYNISHSIHLADAYFKSSIQGGTFQWYPTGLVAGHELQGNFLPNVDRYTIPFSADPKFKRMAKMVYEFDAADVGRSYIYPAMARSFRQAGMQLAAHFSYDPTFMADVNTEYGTHYMNLVYSPQKALSLMIASEVFRLPLYKDYGRYPDNTAFDNFRVSYEEDLAEMISEEKFIYTNSTRSIPPELNKLKKIAGFGKSVVMDYSGSGAYFLDRIAEGIWRLEVMPDAVWVRDPFEKASPKKKVAATHWRTLPMIIHLPDLGKDFSINGVNDGNTFSQKSSDGRFEISPGTYLLVREGVRSVVSPNDRWNNIVIKEFSAPASSVGKIVVKHNPSHAASGKSHNVKALLVSPDSLQSVQLYAWVPGSKYTVTMDNKGGNYYEASIPTEKIQEGFIRYHIIVRENDRTYCYPSGLETHPEDWDFFDNTPYEVAVVSSETPLLLFNAATDGGRLLRPWIRTSQLVPTLQAGRASLEIKVEKILATEMRDINGRKIHDYSMRFFVGDRLAGMSEILPKKKRIIFRGNSLDMKPCKLQIALVSRHGSAYGAVITVGQDHNEYEVALEDLKPVGLVNLPRPYPGFLPYYFESGETEGFDILETELLQLSIGPGIEEDALQQQHGISIESIILE